MKVASGIYFCFILKSENTPEFLPLMIILPIIFHCQRLIWKIIYSLCKILEHFITHSFLCLNITKHVRALRFLKNHFENLNDQCALFHSWLVKTFFRFTIFLNSLERKRGRARRKLLRIRCIRFIQFSTFCTKYIIFNLIDYLQVTRKRFSQIIREVSLFKKRVLKYNKMFSSSQF